MPDWASTPQFWLSLALAAAGCTGLVLAGRGKMVGWLIGLLIQPVWVVFAFVTRGYGLVVTAVMYAAVYGSNLAREVRRRRGGDDMGLSKYGHGQVLPEPGDSQKTASERWSEKDEEALAQENEEADGGR